MHVLALDSVHSASVLSEHTHTHIYIYIYMHTASTPAHETTTITTFYYSCFCCHTTTVATAPPPWECGLGDYSTSSLQGFVFSAFAKHGAAGRSS